MVNLKELNPQYITNETGIQTDIIISMKKFNELLEDIEDLAAIAERRKESSISHEELLKELKKDGFI